MLLLKSTYSLPINIRNVRETAAANELSELDFHVNLVENTVTNEDHTVFVAEQPVNVTENAAQSRTLRNQIRPGMVVTNYIIEIDPHVDGGTFSGRLTTDVSIDRASVEDPVMFYVRDLDIDSVTYALVGGTIFRDADFSVDEDEGTLEIDTGQEATVYKFIIEYTGSLEVAGQALYAGSYSNV